MSACSDFAEHVWKPGSCKNCFHQLSAHKTNSHGSSLPATCPKSGGGGGDEDAGVTSPSPYSKPTIAVKPTMMSLDTTESLTDVNLNKEQENTKSPMERLGFKKFLDLSSLYINGNGCTKGHRDLQSPESKKDFNNCFSPTTLSPNLSPKDSKIISNIFVTQEEARCPQTTKKNRDLNCRQQNTSNISSTKSTYGGVTNRAHYLESRQASVESSCSDSTPCSPSRVYRNGCKSPTSPFKTSTSSSSPPRVETSPGSQPSAQPSLALSPQSSLSDSSSYQSSTDSLPLAESSGGRQGSPKRPPALATSHSAPTSPSAQDKEPIYAESTKKKSKPNKPNLASPTQINSKASELEVSGESQRATITVMAARLEENNRTFFLSSPDSGVSTQCRFSPPAVKDPASPAFRWPNPSLSAPSLTTETSLSPSLHPKPQCSPPIPPKRTVRSPKLGTSSLSASFSSPVPLPELPKLSTPGISTSLSSPVPLPELPMLFLVSAKEGHFKVQPENNNAPSDRWHKTLHHNSAWNCRIEEEEEEEERKEGDRKTLVTNPSSRVAGLVNGAAVWKESRDDKAQASPPPVTEPGTAPPSVPNNGACQEDTVGTRADEEGRQNVSMRAKQPLHVGSTELLAAGNGHNNQESTPPPPPPKKLHRVSGKLSGSNMELDRWSQQGSLESSASSLKGLGCGSLPSASTDSLSADAGSRDATRMSCSSPFPKSPAGSTPGSPHPSTSSSNQPPPLPEKKLVNRTVSAPDSCGGKSFARAYPRLPFAGSETNVCQPVDANPRSSLPSSPVDPRPIFASNDSLERCHTPVSRQSRSRTLDEPFKVQGRLGLHCRSSHASSSSPQLSTPLSAPEPANLGSSLQLQTLLSNIDSREGVYSKLGGLYAESLRRLALKCEDHFTRTQRNPLRFQESNWSLFRLTSNKPSCNSGDAVYYSAACASDPRNSYAVKICKCASTEARQGHLYGLSVQQSIPPHFNLQQDCGHFLACVPQSMLPSDKASPPSTSASVPPGVSAAGQQGERVVVITPEIPQQTAADFAREWEAFHKSQPEVYERRVCFLLLQLCNGLEHLKEHGVTHRDLCLENLLLVPHSRRPPQQTPGDTESTDVQRQLPRLLISNFAKSKRRSAEAVASTGVDPRSKRDHARLAPEIVSAAQYRKFDEFQTGILIYELLHQANPFEVSPALKEQDYRCEDLPPIPPVSLYSAGLHKLAQLLLQPDPIKRIHIQEAKRILQSLLWGPRKDLMEQQYEGRGPGGLVDGSRHESLLNWLDVKRALLMMKFAERSLEPERNAELEDWLCCQYFSSANPLSLCHTAELLYMLK
ncbi:inactive tyrosine-protein kinase PRAG1 [Synchiropus splendidus]|uniref:inactive tyrosine-protein kinase PRAG1 n=1 Tax=Synchiropus splendidus TaxID=270530 RepID=UPI00237DF483|nr:inactive tyrosine-protein kinase PRAG1 [Synchiropus splendidus]